MIFTGLKCVYAWGVGWGALLVCLPAFAQSPVVPEPEGDRVIRTVTLTSAVAGAPGSSFSRNHIGPAQQATRTARRLEFKGREPSASVRFRGTDGLPDSERVPDYLVGESLRSIWRSGVEFERREQFLDSAASYQVIASEVPGQAYTYWRIARNYWRQGEGMPRKASAARLHYFELAEEWSARGLEVDPDCGACMLWKFVSIGRQATTRGLLSAIPRAREMDQLLRRGIELQPRHRDDRGNSTLGNLYYAASVFYRIVPDWWWLRVVVGVRGDKERSVRYARRAVEIADIRIDYRIELGASLLCLGVEKGRKDRVTEGLSILRHSLELDPYLSTDTLDREHALILLESPELSCGYSRDGFIDVGALREQAEARR